MSWIEIIDKPPWACPRWTGDPMSLLRRRSRIVQHISFTTRFCGGRRVVHAKMKPLCPIASIKSAAGEFCALLWKGLRWGCVSACLSASVYLWYHAWCAQRRFELTRGFAPDILARHDDFLWSSVSQTHGFFLRLVLVETAISSFCAVGF